MTGLLPPAQGDLVIEIDRAKAALEMRCSDLEKYQVCSCCCCCCSFTHLSGFQQPMRLR